MVCDVVHFHQYETGDTPLHNASSGGHVAVVDMLLKANANPSAANKVMTFV